MILQDEKLITQVNTNHPEGDINAKFHGNPSKTVLFFFLKTLMGALEKKYKQGAAKVRILLI